MVWITLGKVRWVWIEHTQNGKVCQLKVASFLSCFNAFNMPIITIALIDKRYSFTEMFHYQQTRGDWLVHTEIYTNKLAFNNAFQ